MIDFNLPERTARPRDYGLSNLVDNGYGLKELEDKLVLASEYVDIVKFGWGSAHITRTLAEKVALFRRFGVESCPGGMLFELSWWQGRIDDYVAFMQANGITTVEVSNGSLPIPERDKLMMVEHLSGKGFRVLSEVGSKDVSVNAPPEVWARCVRDDRSAGAWKVITEGRADASAGIYDSSGALRTDVIAAILDSGVAAKDLIFEAPHKAQMTWFIRELGANVNIGNIPLDEVLNLETLRLGLRGDTVRHFHKEDRTDGR